MADLTKDEELRIHALNVAASCYREVFRIGKDGEEDRLGELVVADADKYLAFLRGDAEAYARRNPLRTCRKCGTERSVDNLAEDPDGTWMCAYCPVSPPVEG